MIWPPKIEVLTDHDGDWTIIRGNDELIYEGHSFREDIFLEWMESKGYIELNKYSLEDREINYGEKSYDKCPGWVKTAYDEHIDNLKFEEGF